MKTEWIKTNSAQVEVPMEWLLNMLERMATEDAEQVAGDKESYIAGRKDHLYEELSNPDFAEDIANLATDSGVILTSKSIEKSKTYYMQTGIFNEKDTVKARAEKGEILATAGGFPVCPMNITWRGTEADMKEIEAMGVEVNEALNYQHSQEMRK